MPTSSSGSEARSRGRYTNLVRANGIPLSRAGLLVGLAIPLAFLAYLRLGSHIEIPWPVFFAELFRGPGADSTHNTVLWEIRMPRACLVAIVGALLGLVGSAFQAILRNPLADPYIVGVSSGAAVGGAGMVVAGLGAVGGGVPMFLGGFVGGMLSLALVYALSSRRGTADISTLLLAGVTVGTLLSAVLSMLLLLAGQDTNRILGFLLGHTSDANWTKVALSLPFLVLGFPLLMRWSRWMNAFAVGEGAAQRLGLDAVRLPRMILLLGTAMTAAAVSVVGIVGFMGLVAPHIARRIVGVDWRRSLPLSGLIGAFLMLIADLLGQRAMPTLTGAVGMEINVGVMAALIAAPSLLILLRRPLTSL